MIENIRTWTRDLSSCSRMLYHWAMFPHFYITNLHLYFIYGHAVWAKEIFTQTSWSIWFSEDSWWSAVESAKIHLRFWSCPQKPWFLFMARLHFTCEHELKKLHLLWMIEYMLHWIGDLSIAVECFITTAAIPLSTVKIVLNMMYYVLENIIDIISNKRLSMWFPSLFFTNFLHP